MAENFDLTKKKNSKGLIISTSEEEIYTKEKDSKILDKFEDLERAQNGSRKDKYGSQLFPESNNKFYKRTAKPKQSSVREFSFLKSPLVLQTITENSVNEEPNSTTNKDLIKRLATETNSLFKITDVVSSRLSRSDITMSLDDHSILTTKVITEPFLDTRKYGRVFVDEIFPPNITSLVNNKKKAPMEFKRFSQFLRIKQIYSNSAITLAQDVSPRFLRINERLHPGFAQALFIIANHPSLIERIFRGNEVNKTGIYIVRLYFNGIWKEITLDDSFPVDLNKKTFLVEQLASNFSDYDIWPLLIQKAVAKLYGSYESMLPVNTDYILHLLTGLPCFTPNSFDQNYTVIEFVTFSKKAQYLHVVSRNFTHANIKDYVEFIDENIKDLTIERKNMQEFQMKNEDFEESKLSNYMIPILPNHFCNVSSFKHHKNTYSIRKICVKSKTKLLITVSQFDKSLFRKVKYDISPVRLFVVKVLENEELKITAKAYFLKREYSMEIDLKSGIYLIFIMVDWLNQPYKAGISIFSDLEIALSRIPYREGSGLLEFALKTEIMDQGQETGKGLDRKLTFFDENFSYISNFCPLNAKSKVLKSEQSDRILLQYESSEAGEKYNSPGFLVLLKNVERVSFNLKR